MSDARTITHALGGRWHSSYGVARCPVHDDRRPSLSIRDGDHDVLLTCHAGCDRRDIVATLAGMDLWGQSRARGGRRSHSAPTWPGPADGNARAIRWWREARPAEGTPAEMWLRTRGWSGPIPPSIRFHPRCPYGHEMVLPAMLGAIQASDRRIVAVHRTFLAADGCRKANLGDVRLWKGECGDGAVRLAPADVELGIAEGIEDGLSVMELGGPACWVAGNATRLANVALPACVKHVHIFRDRDEAGRRGANTSASRYTSEGRRVTIHTPPDGCKDFNDVLMAREVAA